MKYINNILKKNTAEIMKNVALAAILAAVVVPMPAFAQTSADGLFQKILALLTGTIAKVIAAIAIVLCGFATMAGRLDKGMFMSVLVGVVIIFSASWIVNQIT
jgi:type IV secretory pathway VirB2 component (pilin)